MPKSNYYQCEPINFTPAGIEAIKNEYVYPHSAPVWKTNFDISNFYPILSNPYSPTINSRPNYDYHLNASPSKESIPSYDHLPYLSNLSTPSRPSTAPSHPHNPKKAFSMPKSHKRHASNPIIINRKNSNSDLFLSTTNLNSPKVTSYQVPPPYQIPQSQSGSGAITFVNFSSDHAVLLCEAVAPSGSRKRASKEGKKEKRRISLE